MKPMQTSSIPALKDTDGVWSRSSIDKANLLSRTYREKAVLPVETVNEYTPPDLISDVLPSSALLLDERDTERIMAKLEVNSGTGPDGIATRYLKSCRAELAAVLTRLFYHLLHSSYWPHSWRKHWIHSIWKKSSKA